MAPSATCSRCEDGDETILHCLCDCRFSTNIWLQLGFAAQDFFNEGISHIWIKNNAAGTRSPLFLAGLRWTWRHRNLMCLSQETWSLPRLNFHIQNTVDVIKATFHSALVHHTDRMVRWNNNNCNCIVLNVDGSCLGSPIRVGYGGIIRNSAGFFLTCFSDFIATHQTYCLPSLPQFKEVCFWQ